MATLDSILADKKLLLLTIQLGRHEFYERKMYVYPECLMWMRTEVPKMVTGRVQSAMTPSEQLTLRIKQWISGKPMAYDRMFKDMWPRTDEVWELKTADLRIFGCMYKPCQFIAVRGGYADDYKAPTKTKNYADDIRAVVSARNALPLEGAKFVTGEFDELV